MSYRADIDGLRAIAVLAVVLFHAQVAHLAGGFVGVDIFFVISGYLITGMLVAQHTIDWPFLRGFYERRIRRLLPPVIPVLLLSVVAGYIVLLPDETSEFARSLLAFQLFRANWFFLSIAGYFDGPSQLKPLLHTWSLSVEEQFYLLFPVALMVMAKRRAIYLNLCLVCVLLGSLATCIYFSYAALLDNAFFNSAARFWEIALGALLATGAIKMPLAPWARNTAGLVGLFVIALCINHAPNATILPAFLSVAASGGTALIILAPQSVVSRLLGARPLVGIGLVSYGFYLWHWPILAFLRITSRVPGFIHTMEAVASAFLLAVASYLLLERPVRTRRLVPQSRHVFMLLLASTMIFGALGIGGVITGGYPSRFPKEATDYQKHLALQRRDERHAALKNSCWLGGQADLAPALAKCLSSSHAHRRVLLVGDSHAAHLFAALQHAYGNLDVQLLAVNSCSLSGNGFDLRRAPCKGIDAFLDQLRGGEFDAVIMTSHAYLKPQELPGYVQRAAHLGRVTPVIVLGPIQEYQPSMPSIYARYVGRFSPDWIARRLDASVSPDRFAYDTTLRNAFADLPGVTYISLLEHLCPARKCRHFDADGWPILIDNSHLSVPASMQVVAELSNQLPLHALDR